MKENRRFCPRRWALLLMLLVLAMGLSAGARADTGDTAESGFDYQEEELSGGDSGETPTAPVAKIGSTEYSSLRAALDTVPRNNTNPVTIELMANVVLKWQSGDNALDVNKDNVVIDGKDHTISAGTSDDWKQYEVNGANPSFGSYKLIKVSGSNVTLKNMTVDGGETYRGVSCVTTVGGKNVTYEGITLEGRGSGHYYGIGSGNIIFRNCIFNTHGYGINNSEGGNFTILIDGCTIHGWNSFAPAESVTIKDTTFYGALDEGKNGLLAKVRPYSSATLTNCQFSEEYIYVDEETSEWCGIDSGKGRNDVIVELNGCSFINNSTEPIYKAIHDTNNPNTVHAIDATGDSTSGYTGGTFVTGNKDNIPVAEGYQAVAVNNSNVYKVVRKYVTSEPTDNEAVNAQVNESTAVTVAVDATTDAGKVAFSDVTNLLLDKAVNSSSITNGDSFTLGTKVVQSDDTGKTAAQYGVQDVVEAHLEAFITRTGGSEVARANVSNAQLKNSITFNLPVTSAISSDATAVRVTHFKENGDTEDLGEKTIQVSDNSRYVTVTVNSFSDFGLTETTDHTSDYSDAFTAALVPQANTVALNGTVAFDLKLSGTKDANINAMEFVLSSTSGLSVTEVTNKTNLSMDRSSNSIAFSSGTTSLALAADTPVTIATITMQAANPSNDTYLTDGQTLTVSLSTRKIKVSQNNVKDDVNANVTDGTVTLNEKVTITYVYDYVPSGETSGRVEHVSSGYNCSVTPPTTPLRDTYTFVNWYQVNNAEDPVAVNAQPYNFESNLRENIFLKAKWTPTEFNITFADVEGANNSNVENTYTFLTGVQGTPVRNGYEFVGWQEDPVDANSNNPQWVDNKVYTTAETVGLYGDVRLKSVWKVNADVAIADYAYAYNNGTSDADVLMVVKVASPVTNAAYYYGDNKLYTTNSAPYRSLVSVTDENTSVYVYLISKGEVKQENNKWVLKDVTKLTFKMNDSNEAISRNGDVNRSSSVTAADWGIVGDMLRDGGKFFSRDFLSVRERLEADVAMDGNSESNRFGSVDDIASIITKRSSINSN